MGEEKKEIIISRFLLSFQFEFTVFLNISTK